MTVKSTSPITRKMYHTITKQNFLPALCRTICNIMSYHAMSQKYKGMTCILRKANDSSKDPVLFGATLHDKDFGTNIHLNNSCAR